MIELNWKSCLPASSMGKQCDGYVIFIDLTSGYHIQTNLVDTFFLIWKQTQNPLFLSRIDLRAPNTFNKSVRMSPEWKTWILNPLVQIAVVLAGCGVYDGKAKGRLNIVGGCYMLTSTYGSIIVFLVTFNFLFCVG